MAHEEPNSTGSFPRKSILQRECYFCGKVRCLLKSHGYLTQRMFYQGEQHEMPYQVGDQKPDALAKYPIPLNGDLDKLYALAQSKWKSDFNGPERHLFPYPLYTIIFKHGWRDKALHYGVLSVIATQTSLLQHGIVDNLALDLQNKAITAQREASIQEKYLDARILTAMCIISNSYARNVPEDHSSHIQLITDWLQKCGGLLYLGFDGIVADTLMYNDFTRSIQSNTAPQFSLSLPAVTLTCSPPAGPHYDQLRVKGLLSQEVTAAANDYIIMVKIFDRAARNQTRPSEATYFAYLANVVEYQLACANALYRDTNTLEECITLACVLGNIVIMRNCAQLSHFTWTVEGRFWRCLVQLQTMNVFSLPHLRRLEWYLTCAGVMTATRGKCKYEQRVVGELVRFRRDPHRPLSNFEELCRTMDDYGWCKSPCVALFSRLWNESSRLLVNSSYSKQLPYCQNIAPNHVNRY